MKRLFVSALSRLRVFFIRVPRISLLIGLCCASMSQQSIAATNNATLTLEHAVEKTLQHNPQLYQFDFIRQRLQQDQQTAQLKPAYELGLDLENIAGTGDLSGLDHGEITVALSSVIELGGKKTTRQNVAQSQLNKFELDRQVKTLDLLGDLTSNFILVLSVQHELMLAREAERLSEALLNTVRKRAQSGAASDAEVMRAKAMLTLLNIQKANLIRKLERQKMSLARFWGDTNFEFSSVQGDLYAFGKSESFASLFEKLQQSPAIAVFASELRLKEAEVQLAQSQNRADLSWQFGVRRFEESGDAAFSVGLSMPLANKNRNKSTVQAAFIERNMVEFQRSDRLLLLRDQLFSAYSQRQQFVEGYQALQHEVIPDLEKALDITHEAYNRGSLKYQDWINAQQELLNAKQQLIEMATAALLNQALIERLTAEPLTH